MFSGKFIIFSCLSFNKDPRKNLKFLFFLIFPFFVHFFCCIFKCGLLIKINIKKIKIYFDFNIENNYYLYIFKKFFLIKNIF